MEEKKKEVNFEEIRSKLNELEHALDNSKNNVASFNDNIAKLPELNPNRNNFQNKIKTIKSDPKTKKQQVKSDENLKSNRLESNVNLNKKFITLPDLPEPKINFKNFYKDLEIKDILNKKNEPLIVKSDPKIDIKTKLEVKKDLSQNNFDLPKLNHPEIKLKKVTLDQIQPKNVESTTKPFIVFKELPKLKKVKINSSIFKFKDSNKLSKERYTRELPSKFALEIKDLKKEIKSDSKHKETVSDFLNIKQLPIKKLKPKNKSFLDYPSFITIKQNLHDSFLTSARMNNLIKKNISASKNFDQIEKDSLILNTQILQDNLKSIKRNFSLK